MRSRGALRSISDHAEIGEGAWLGDAPRLKQVLVNLLLNAGRRSRNGRVSLSAKVDGEWLAFEVVDSGPGLPTDVLDHLFQPVVSNKGAAHQGIGLAIVRQLVRELDGLINCRSSSQGTCFQILIPHSQNR